MANHRPIDLTEHPAPPFPPNSPEPGVRRRSSASRAKNAVRELLFGNAKVKRHAVDEQVRHIQQRDEEHHVSVTGHPDLPDIRQVSTDVNQRSPSIEAQKADTTNQNGFGDDEQFGWPGLGTWHGLSAPNERRQQTISPQRRTEKSIEAAIDEAIDEAADESYGWAGLGTWPSSKTK